MTECPDCLGATGAITSCTTCGGSGDDTRYREATAALGEPTGYKGGTQ